MVSPLIVTLTVCVVTPVLAILRIRPLPPPAWTYLLCGLVIALVAAGPLWGVQIPAGLDLGHLDRLVGATAAPSLTTEALSRLPRPQQLLSGSGLVLLLLGLADLGLFKDGGRR